MTANGYREKERRLVMLRITHEGSGVANDRLLKSGLAHWGLACSLREVRKELDWLETHGLVECVDLPSSSATPVRRVTITPRGRAVATGKEDVDGVTPRGQVAD